MASRSWNRVELIGNLTRDPELRFTPNGAAVCTFGLATNRTYVSEGERKEEADFHRLVAWNKLAELCNQLLKKGHRVFVSGRLQTRSWEGQDGQTRQTTEIVIEDMILLTPKAFNGDVASGDIGREDIPTLPSKVAPKAEEGVDEAVEEAAEEKSPASSSVDKAASAENSGPASTSESEASEPKEEKSKTASKTDKSANPPQENVSEDEDLPF